MHRKKQATFSKKNIRLIVKLETRKRRLIDQNIRQALRDDLLWRLCDTLCISGFVDSVMPSYNRPYSDVSLPQHWQQRQCSRAQANTPAAC